MRLSVLKNLAMLTTSSYLARHDSSQVLIVDKETDALCVVVVLVASVHVVERL